MIDWRIFWILLGASVFGMAGVFPFAITLQSDLIRNASVPLHTLVLSQMLQGIFLFAIANSVDLILSKKVGLGQPFLNGLIKGEHVRVSFKHILVISLIVGVAAGVVVKVLDLCFSAAAWISL